MRSGWCRCPNRNSRERHPNSRKRYRIILRSVSSGRRAILPIRERCCGTRVARRSVDPRVLNTVQVVDALLKVDLPAGPCWHRYNDDGYGEHEDGRPFDGTGVGRAWPLLTGERAHYELSAGNRVHAEALLAALEGFGSDGHLIP